jgi:hypothetical protein
MRKPGATGVAAALVAGLALAAARADDGDGGDLRSLPPVKPSRWSGRLFGGKEPAAPPKPRPAEAAVPPPRVPPVADPQTVQAREESAYLRRMDVCLNLLEVAQRKGDEELIEQVNQMMDRVWQTYQNRTGGPAARSTAAAADAAALTRPARSVPDPTRRAAVRDAAPWNQQGEEP